ncbi:MAG: hypothetical protein K8R11_02860 [Methanococcoides sp.]|nr:hypothetical protein [Methanococcoides sp.]
MYKVTEGGIFRQTFIGIVLISILTLPAAATSVLDIQVTESLNVEDLYNGTLTQGSATGSGVITITNELSSTPLYDISLNFSNGTTLSSSWIASSGMTLDTSENGHVIVHINSLVNGASETISYECSGSRPILFEESYEFDKILVNDSTNVTLTLNNTASSTISNILLVKTAVDSDTDSTPDFLFSNAESTVGLVLMTIDKDVIRWNGFSLTAGATATLNFTATENDADAHANSESLSAVEYYMGNASLQFTINDGTTSGSGITLNDDPTAVTSNFAISLDKNQLDQTEGGNGDGDDWGFTPEVTNTDSESIDFSISAVNVYVTNNVDLETAIDSTTYNPGTLSSGATWTDSEWPVLDFPDPVPVGWIDVDLSVDLSGDQLIDSYSTTNGTYQLIEKIYIINGYLVEAKKTITKNATEDYYDVSLWVHNKGNLATPPHVVVYDIVPQNFSLEYNETNPTGNTAVTSPIQGVAHWWDVGSLEAHGTADNQTYINYTVSGAGIYRMSDLFILGIDPAYSLDLPSTPVLTTGTKVATSTNVESVMSVLMLVSLLVGVVGMRRNKRD